MSSGCPKGFSIDAPVTAELAQILTPEALPFIAKRQRALGGRRQELLDARVRRQAEIDAGKLPDVLLETKHIREGDQTIALLPRELERSRVEITGPVERRMIINRLNSGRPVLEEAPPPALAPEVPELVAGLLEQMRRIESLAGRQERLAALLLLRREVLAGRELESQSRV